jgi:hypothetical protein
MWHSLAVFVCKCAIQIFILWARTYCVWHENVEVLCQHWTEPANCVLINMHSLPGPVDVGTVQSWFACSCTVFMIQLVSCLKCIHPIKHCNVLALLIKCYTDKKGIALWALTKLNFHAQSIELVKIYENSISTICGTCWSLHTDLNLYNLVHIIFYWGESAY